MDYNHSFDSREHDSGYFTPSPDKDTNKIDSSVSYKKLELTSNIKKAIANSSLYGSMENATNVTDGNINSLPQQQQQHPHNLMSEKKNFLNSSQVANANPNPNNLISHGANPALSDVDRPPHSYIALISMAILSKTERKILLNEIYDWVIQNFPYYQFRTDKSWRNSIRHNLSLNECFIKVGKAGNGRGYYWSIHGANMVDFKKGDFRRRQARLRAKHDKASSSKNSEGGSSKSKKSQQQQQQQQQLQQQQQQTDLLNSQVSINDNQSQYPKTFSSPSLINQNQYSSYHYQSQQPQQQQQHQQSNLNLLTNSQDYQNLSPQHNHQSGTNGNNLQYANSYQNMYQQTASKPIAQQLNSFNYNTLHQSHEYPTDLNGTYSQYSNEVSSENTSLDSTSKFLSPTTQTGGFNESLLTKATSNTSSTALGSQLASKLQGSGSLSTSPSSSTSSTSSQSSQSQQYANYYANSGYHQGHQNHNGQHTQNHSQSHLNHQQSNQYNAYLSNTFPWLPQANHSSHGNMMAAQNNFLETLTSAASAASSAVSNTVPPVVSSSAYDLNTFPYHNSQVHRI